MKINKKTIKKINKTEILNFFKVKKNRIIAYIVAGILVLTVILSAVIKSLNKEESVYRETEVVKGNLTVGTTIDGTIAVGTTTQALDIDISAYTGSSEISFSNMNSMGSGGGMPSVGGMPGGGGMPSGGNSGSGMSLFSGTNSSSSTASGDRTLKVEAVYVSVGQKLSVGDPILKLSEESVNEIRSKLEEDVTSAEVTYRQQTTEAELADLSAGQTLDSNKNKGSYAQIEYDQTVRSLQTAVESAQEKYDDAVEELDELKADLEEYTSKLAEYKKVLENAEFTVNNINVRDNVYGWTTAENAREEAESLYNKIVDSIESTEESIKSKESTVASYESLLASAINDQKQGIIEAQATYDKAMLNFENADDIYEVSMGQTDLANKIAEDDYNEAKAKLDEFNETIDGQTVVAGYDGVITDVLISTGDYIGTGTELITVNDYNEVTITVSVEEADIEFAQEGCKANVYIPALPDEYYTAEVTEVGDASYDSSSATTYYEITVTLSGNTKALYAGMNAEVTFISKETEEVLHVSNRAIIRENGKSVVKMKDGRGNIVAREVETGFSDGNSVEIKSGLEEGDVVLIESKVSD